MSDDERHEDERPGRGGDDEAREHEVPPPATWAGRRASDDEAAGDEEVGAGIIDEFSLDEEAGAEPQAPEEPGESESPAPPEEPAEEPPPPVDEPPEPDAPEPIEEPHAPGAPPSGAGEPGATQEFVPEGVEPEPAEDEEPAAEEAEPAAEAPEPEAGEPAADEPAVVKQPPPVPLGEPAGTPAAAGKDEKPPRAGLWPRFIAAAFVIITSMATATAASILLYFTDIAESLGGLPGLDDVLESVDGGEPQTVLILGSDKRPEDGIRGHSDTTMLLRLDPEKNVLSLLSLPRDLKVNIPGHGLAKLNEAYTIGGPKLTLETVSDLTGLDIHHVVNIDFAGFAEAVNEIECVFVDVDRHYFNSNEGILDPTQQFAEIDIDAGYQQLCGKKALDYVRYRHDDNDLVRAARQQSFLREARQKVPPERLFTKRREFIKIFTKYTTSDIDDPIAMLDTLKLFIELREAPVRRIEFQGDIGDATSAYVTASNEQIKTAVRQFLGNEPAPAEKEARDNDKRRGGGRGGGGGGGGGARGGGGGGGGAPEDTPMIDASGAASQYALQFDGRLRFPVLAPVQLVPGSTYSDDSRAYTIDTYDGEHYPSYKLVFSRASGFGVPEYYGVMGTKWTNPPILENPSETRRIGDREYLLFYEGDRLQVVGWKTPKAAYWVSNSLTGSLSEEQMLAVAEAMKPFSPER